MPELPEVEVTRRGIAAPLTGLTVDAVTVREPRLRWPVPAGLSTTLPGQTLRDIERRAKYLLLRFDRGTLILHLGMSGSLRVLDPAVPADPPPVRPRVTYLGHKEGAGHLTALFPGLRA